jgi:cell division septation protein DedD
MAAPEEPSHQSHDLEDISVRKKDDNHTFIFVCLLILPIVTYLAGHSVGKTKGIAIAMAFQQSQSKPTAITSSRKPVVQATTTRAGTPAKPAPRAGSILPTTLKTLTPAQARAAAPLTPPKMYSLQIQTFGPNQRKSIDELINALKAAGFDAFANYRNGAVFVGRLESSRGPAVEQLKNDIARFNWRKRDFSSTFAYKIPSHLLEK